MPKVCSAESCATHMCDVHFVLNKFCYRCGKPLVKIKAPTCGCGKKFGEHDRYCTKCGKEKNV